MSQKNNIKIKKVLVVGLGLIGASLCRDLIKKLNIKKYKEHKNKKKSKDYDWYFLRYLPREHDKKNKPKNKKKKRKTKRKTKKRKKKGILSRLGFGGRKTRKRRRRRRR